MAFTGIYRAKGNEAAMSISSMPKRALTHFLIWQNFEIAVYRDYSKQGMGESVGGRLRNGRANRRV